MVTCNDLLINQELHRKSQSNQEMCVVLGNNQGGQSTNKYFEIHNC